MEVENSPVSSAKVDSPPADVDDAGADVESAQEPSAKVENGLDEGGDATVEVESEAEKVVQNGQDVETTSPESPAKGTTPPVSPIKVEVNTPAGGDRISSSSPPVSPAKSPTIRLAPVTSTESHDNPFLADGELCKKADTIIRHSTISRTQLKVFDPDTSAPEPEPAVEEPALVPKTAGSVQAARPQDVNVKQQNGGGGVEDALTPQSVEVEVGKANASQPEAQKAEEVKVEKDKKCACCVIQ